MLNKQTKYKEMGKQISGHDILLKMQMIAQNPAKIWNLGISDINDCHYLLEDKSSSIWT